jgi:hypothetical protein
MDALVGFYAAHPFWVWLGLAALLLAIEAAAGTEWLLWPSAAAAIVGFVTLLPLDTGVAVELTLFALLTLIGTFASNRLVKRVTPAGEDVNDRAARLIGHTGEVASPFVDGRGRVLVDGAEWPAELDPGAAAPTGRVRVKAVRGSRLMVEPA